MTNTWWEITVSCTPALEESIFLQLQQFGCHGSANEIKGQMLHMQAHLPGTEAQLQDLEILSSCLQQDAQQLGQPIPKIEWHLIEEEDWSNSWKQNWQPQEIGKRFIAIPVWLTLPENNERLVLRIDPEMAFGTGLHATTQMCLEALEMLLEKEANSGDGMVVADIGCGSGILAIAALLLGGSKAYAVDIDPLSVRATISNSELNQIAPQQLIVAEGSIEKLQEIILEPVDGVVCNILAEAIANLMPQMASVIKPHGWSVLSGIAIDKANIVTDALEQYGWTVCKMWQRKEWCCFYVRRS